VKEEEIEDPFTWGGPKGQRPEGGPDSDLKAGKQRVVIERGRGKRANGKHPNSKKTKRRRELKKGGVARQPTNSKGGEKKEKIAPCVTLQNRGPKGTGGGKGGDKSMSPTEKV